MSKAEEEFAQQLDLVGIQYVREHIFHPIRKWRFDFIFPEAQRKTAVEIQGVTHYGRNRDGSMKLGRHQTHRGIRGDICKFQEAAVLGWVVIPVSQDQVRSGEALKLVERATGQL